MKRRRCFPRKRAPSTCREVCSREAALLGGPRRADGISKHEELRDIEGVGVFGRSNPACRQHKARDTTVATDEKRKAAVRLGPVERKLGVAKAPIPPEVDVWERGAQVVNVQLEQIG